MRPTSGKVREAIFDILGAGVLGARVLDLFAGSGALALEALSRGARTAVVVEDHPGALRVLRHNVMHLGLEEQVTVLPVPVRTALRKLQLQGDDFEVIFLDPPYDRGLAAQTLLLLGASTLPATGGIVVAEHSIREELAKEMNRLRLRESRRYGDTLVSIYLLPDRPDFMESPC